MLQSETCFLPYRTGGLNSFSLDMCACEMPQFLACTSCPTPSLPPISEGFCLHLSPCILLFCSLFSSCFSAHYFQFDFLPTIFISCFSAHYFQFDFLLTIFIWLFCSLFSDAEKQEIWSVPGEDIWASNVKQQKFGIDANISRPTNVNIWGNILIVQCFE